MFDTILNRAWQKSEGKCHCTRFDHNHPYVRCNKPLTWDKQDKPNPSGWVLHRRARYGKSINAAYEILCWQCYQKETSNR
jgi:hypothetical protein